MKTLSFVFSLVVIFLALPTTLILASWDALPGDSLYPVKTGLEDILLAATGKTRVASKLSVQFTERRFSEANKLLSQQGSTLGYELLVEEVTQSKEIVIERDDRENALQLVAKIEEYQKGIEEQRQKLETAEPSRPPLPQPTPKPGRVCIQVITPAKNLGTGECREFPTPCDVPQGWQQVSSCATGEPVHTPPTLIVEPPREELVHPEYREKFKDLTKTKKELEKIKEDLKKELPAAAQKVKEEKEDRDRDSDRVRDRETEIDKEKDKKGNEKHQSDDDKEPRGKNKE